MLSQKCVGSVRIWLPTCSSISRNMNDNISEDNLAVQYNLKELHSQTDCLQHSLSFLTESCYAFIILIVSAMTNISKIIALVYSSQILVFGVSILLKQLIEVERNLRQSTILMWKLKLARSLKTTYLSKVNLYSFRFQVNLFV